MTGSAVESRKRILDAALVLMSEHGVAGTSMRMLAGACDLNVATLYHYFPSKAELLQAVLAERGYLERLRTEQPPAGLTGRGGDAGDAARAGWLPGSGGPASRRRPSGACSSVRASAATPPPGPRRSRWSMASTPRSRCGWPTWCRSSADRAAQVARLVRAMLFSLIVEHLALGP